MILLYYLFIIDCLKSFCFKLLNLFPGSPIKSMEIDYDLYTKRDLSDRFTLYWRILKEEKEIEVIMVVKGTSYAAIGWRPRSLTPSCRNFPEIIDKNQKAKQDQTSPASEPNSEPEPKSEPEPTSEPEPKSEPEPSSEPEPTSSDKPSFKSKFKPRQKSVSSRAAKGEEITREEAVETSVSYRVTASRGKREADEPKPEPTTPGMILEKHCTFR